MSPFRRSARRPINSTPQPRQLAEEVAARLLEEFGPRLDALEAALGAGPQPTSVLTVAQVATALSISPRLVWTLVEEGDLTPFRLTARTTRFLSADVDRLVQNRITRGRRSR